MDNTYTYSFEMTNIMILLWDSVTNGAFRFLTWIPNKASD